MRVYKKPECRKMKKLDNSRLCGPPRIGCEFEFVPSRLLVWSSLEVALLEVSDDWYEVLLERLLKLLLLLSKSQVLVGKILSAHQTTKTSLLSMLRHKSNGGLTDVAQLACADQILSAETWTRQRWKNRREELEWENDSYRWRIRIQSDLIVVAFDC